jgi:hypothetical protein
LTSSVDAALRSVAGVGLFSQILVFLPKEWIQCALEVTTFLFVDNDNNGKNVAENGGKFEKGPKTVFLSDSTKTFLERRHFTQTGLTAFSGFHSGPPGISLLPRTA